MQMPDQSLNILNLFANLVMIVGGVVIAYGVIQIRRMTQRLELVIAPKTGIEGFLNMCAQVVESDPDGTCVVDDSGEIVLVNKRMEEISGYHRSELVGRLIEILVPDSVKGMHPVHREGFVTGPASRPMRGLKLRHKRGSELTVGINLNHYVDASGGFTIAKVRVADDTWGKSGDALKVISQ
jgi:PAS domain S-box-containing protein